MTPTTDSDVRRLGLVAAAAIVVANMIGTGIFTTSGFMAAGLNVPSILAGWAIGAVLALAGAACYGELGAMMPRVGGEYVYLRRAYHPLLAFASGWVSLTVGFSGAIAATALTFGAYGTSVLDISQEPLISAGPLTLSWPGVLAIGLIGFVTVVHAVDVVVGSQVQTAFTLLKVALIVVLIAAGLVVGDGDFANLSSAGTSLGPVASGAFWASMVYVSFSYSGWNAAAYIAGEIREPGRNLPRALLLGTAIVAVLYLLLNLVFFYAAPASALAGQPEVGDVAARALFGDGAGRVLSGLITVALVSSVSAMVMAGPRVYAAMAEDGAFFAVFARRNRGGAPAFSIFLQAGLAIAFVLVSTLRELILSIGFVLSVFAALTVAAVFIMRVREPDAERPYRTWGYPVTPVLFIALSGWMAYFLVRQEPEAALRGTIVVAAGFVVLGLVRLVERSR